MEEKEALESNGSSATKVGQKKMFLFNQPKDKESPGGQLSHDARNKSPCFGSVKNSQCEDGKSGRGLAAVEGSGGASSMTNLVLVNGNLNFATSPATRQPGSVQLRN